MLRIYRIAIDGQDGDRLAELEIGETRSDAARLEIAEQVYATVQHDCDARGSIAEYRCRLTGLPNGQEITSWTMRQRPELPREPAKEDEDGTGANVPQLLGLALANGRDSVQLMVRHTDTIIGHYQRQVASLTAEIERLQSREIQVFELTRRMLVQQSEEREDTRVGDRIDMALGLLTEFGTELMKHAKLLPPDFDPAAAIERVADASTSAVAEVTETPKS